MLRQVQKHTPVVLESVFQLVLQRAIDGIAQLPGSHDIQVTAGVIPEAIAGIAEEVLRQESNHRSALVGGIAIGDQADQKVDLPPKKGQDPCMYLHAKRIAQATRNRAHGQCCM